MGTTHSSVSRETSTPHWKINRAGRNLSLTVNSSPLGIWPSPVTTSLTR